MRRLLLILLSGITLNALQWWRLRPSQSPGSVPDPPLSTSAAQASCQKPLQVEEPAIPPAVATRAEELAVRFTRLEGPRRGGEVYEPGDVLAEAQKLGAAAFLHFCRHSLTLWTGTGDSPRLPPVLSLATLMTRLAELSPETAFSWLLAEPVLHDARPALVQVASSTNALLSWWAVQDPEGALAWFQQARGRPALAPAARLWLQEHGPLLHASVAGTFPSEAVAGLLTVGKASDLSFLERHLTGGLHSEEGRAGFVNALAAASSTGTPETRRKLWRCTLDSLGAAGGTLEEYQAAVLQMPVGEDRALLAMDAFSLAGSEPEFLQWAMEHFGEPDLVKSIGSLSAGWVQRDAEGATAWAARQRPGPLLDSFINGLFPPLAQADPDSALSWAAAISAPKARTSALGIVWANLTGYWRSSDGGPPSAGEIRRAAEAFRAHGIDPAPFETRR